MKKKIIEKEILERIKKLADDFQVNNLTGFPPVLYTDKRFQKVFVKAVVKHGTNAGQVHQEIINAKFFMTKKTIDGYMVRLFGSYKKRGRPPKFLQGKEGRKF